MKAQVTDLRRHFEKLRPRSNTCTNVVIVREKGPWPYIKRAVGTRHVVSLQLFFATTSLYVSHIRKLWLKTISIPVS